MTTSTFPAGFRDGVTIRGVPLTVTNPGKVVFLYNGTALQPGDKGGSDGNKGTYNAPASTLAGAMAMCTAARGDIIVAKAGHAETISTATAAEMTKSGVSVLGLGTGTNRPKFTLDTANTATIAVSADNISFTNCQFVGNFLSIAACFTLTTAKWFTLQNCTFTDAGATLNFLNIVKSTGAANTADGLSVQDCAWYGTGTTSVNSFALIADANNAVLMVRNRVVLERVADASILLTVTTGASLNIELGDNVVISKQTATTNGTLAALGASSTGVVYRNFSGTLVTASDKLFTTTVGVFPFENRVSGVVGATGFVIPAVDS